MARARGVRVKLSVGHVEQGFFRNLLGQYTSTVTEEALGMFHSKAELILLQAIEATPVYDLREQDYALRRAAARQHGETRTHWQLDWGNAQQATVFNPLPAAAALVYGTQPHVITSHSGGSLPMAFGDDLGDVSWHERVVQSMRPDAGLAAVFTQPNIRIDLRVLRRNVALRLAQRQRMRKYLWNVHGIEKTKRWVQS